MARVIERITGRASYTPPPSIAREIGRIIVRFAYFENCVLEMVWQSLGLSQAAGRIAVRDPRVTDRLDMLRDTIAIRHGTWDEELFKSIRRRVNLIAAKRHMLVHGIWYYHEGEAEWQVQLTRGSWPKDEEELEFKSKKIIPEGVPITAAELRATTAEIGALIEDLTRLRSSASDIPTP